MENQVPVIVALIDVGSTSARLQIHEILHSGKINLVEALISPITIGSDTFAHGRISAKAIRALCTILQNFSKLANEYRVSEIRAFATTAFREAENKDLVVERIRHETGIYLQVLDVIEESRIICQLVLPFVRTHLANTRKHTLFAEIGGGSIVTLLLRKDKIIRANYRRVGTARLSRQSRHDTEPYQFCENIIHNTVDSMLLNYRNYAIDACAFINPQMTKIISKLSEVKTIDGGFCVSVNALKQLNKTLRQFKNSEKIAEHLAMADDDAQRLIPALITILSLCEHLKSPQFYLINGEMLDAAVREMQLSLQNKNPLVEFNEQVIRSARGIGERYCYDEKHSLQVANLAGQLFDELASFLDLTDKDRLLLEVAAILHDIGKFVSEEAHHKHSQYLIGWAEIIGINRDDCALTAMIARYHRKANPLPTHEEYARLNLADRLRVSKLSALLRIADALDHSHLQAIKKLTTQIKDDILRIVVVSKTELANEQRVFKEKSNLLSLVTGLTIELKRK